MSTGYACPVCGDPQADIDHLANHLAFTAMLREDGHADWLDEHVPDWSERGEAELASALSERTDLLEEREFPQVFEDTTDDNGDVPGRDDPAERSGALFDDGEGHGHDHQHGHASGHDHRETAGGRRGTDGRQADLPGGVDPDALPGGSLPAEEREEIMEEAREMTRQLREADDGESADADGTAADE
jgi:hypothetical protein